LFPLAEIEDFEALRKQHNLAGLNVTIPYKQAIIPYLDSMSDEVRAVGAVNTIAFEQGKLRGYNTDIYGFATSLRSAVEAHGRWNKTAALILGTGGASLAAQYVLRQWGWEFELVSRQKNKLNYSDLHKELILKHRLIINTTPLGMLPDIETCPDIPYQWLGCEHLLFDMVYNPEETRFLWLGKQAGAYTKNGLEMLSLQAEKAWEIWTKPHALNPIIL
jgi:shikimate dehydrogenase